MLTEHLFWQKLAGRLNNTLFIMTADHGLAEVDPQATVYINRDPNFSGIERFIKTNRHDQLLVPAGSPRDMFLHIKESRLDEAQQFLATRLTGKADVCRVETLIEQGYFGPQPVSDIFLGRVGNLVILPYVGEAVWWYEENRFEQKFYGHHGGLTRQEMEIPFLACHI
jgi:hypothetical protein